LIQNSLQIVLSFAIALFFITGTARAARVAFFRRVFFIIGDVKPFAFEMKGGHSASYSSFEHLLAALRA
jgi:hypothetical protein